MLIRTNIYLDKETLNTLRRIAGVEKKSVAEVVRGIVKEAIKTHPAKEKTKDPFGKILAYTKKNHRRDIEGKTDVAINHDYYLYVEPYEKKNSS